MRYIDPDELFRCLVSEVHSGCDFSTSPLIAKILTALAIPGPVGVPHAVLVHVPLGFEFLEEAAEVLVSCSVPQVFDYVRSAFNDERLRFEVRKHTESAPSRTVGSANSRGDEQLKIYGFIESYCVFCIHRHARHNCLTFQFC
jgi:hypothetical protein